MKKIILLAAVIVFSIASTSQALEECSRGARSLYKDIQIYKQTEQLMPNEGLIGDRLAKDLSTLRMEDSLSAKVQSLETTFSKCDVYLEADDETEIMMTVEAMKKMKSPLITE